MLAVKELTEELSEKEISVIAHSIDMGFTSGSMGNVEWELECEPDASAALIAMKFKLTSGQIVEDGWNVSYKRYKGLVF